MKSGTNPDLGNFEQRVVNGTWLIEDGNLIVTNSEEEDAEFDSISLENDNLFYLNIGEGSYSQTL